MTDLTDLLGPPTLEPVAFLPGHAEQATAALDGALAIAERPVEWLNAVADALASPSPPQALAPLLAAEHAPLFSALALQPAAWQTALAEALGEQAQAFDRLLRPGSQSQAYPRLLLEGDRNRHQARLLERFGELPPSAPALATYREHLARRAGACQASQQALGGLSLATIEQAPAALLPALRDALWHEAWLQHEEGALPADALAWLGSHLAPGTFQCCAVNVGGMPIPGAWVLADAYLWQANTHAQHVFLWLHGAAGGLQYVAHPSELRERLAFTLRCGVPTPLMQQLAPRLPATFSLDGPVGFEVLPDGLLGGLREIAGQWQAAAQAIKGGQGPWPDMPLVAAQERAWQETLGCLAIADNATRLAAIGEVEGRWFAAAVIDRLPPWLLALDEAARRRYTDQLGAYHHASQRLEHWLADTLPSFADFAGKLMAARIRRALCVSVAPDAPFIERPMAVEYRPYPAIVEPPPADLLIYPPAEPGPRWVAGDAWETLTLAQFACENIDLGSEMEQARLAMAHLLAPFVPACEPGDQGPHPEHARWQWTPHYLGRLLAEEDPLRRYEQLLEHRLAPEESDDPQRLLEPYEHEISLCAQVAHWRRQLSRAGLNMLLAAAVARTPAALEQAGLCIHTLQLSIGVHPQRGVQGVGVVERRSDGLAVLYLPGVPHGPVLVERPQVGAVSQWLLDELKAQPHFRQYLAERLKGLVVAEVLSYMNQAALRDYHGYLSLHRSAEQTLGRLQLADRRLLLLAQAEQHGRSQRSILQARPSAAQYWLGWGRFALSFVPGIGTLISLQEAYESVRLLQEAGGRRDAVAAFEAAGALGASVLDVLTSLVPGLAGLPALRKAAAARRLLHSGNRLPALALRYTPQDRQYLHGRDTGSFLRGGEQWIELDGHLRQVYRRPGEGTLRLRRLPGQFYEAPVRREGMHWARHADVGVLGGGGKLTAAESVFADWGAGRRATALAQGRRLLAQFDFLDDTAAEEFARAYVAEARIPQWALQYRRTGDLPGPPPADHLLAGLEVAITPADRFFGGQYGGQADIMFSGEGVTRPHVRLNGRYYPLMGRPVANDRRTYIPGPGPLPESLGELDRLIERGAGPLRVQLGDSVPAAATLLGPYPETFIQRLRRVRPWLTDETVEAWGEALYREGEVPGIAPPHNRLHGQRLRRLEDIVEGRGKRLDDYREPLRGLDLFEVRQLPVVFGLGAPVVRFDRLGIRLGADDVALARRSMANIAGGFSQVVERVLTRGGYEILDNLDHHGRTLTLFRRAGLPDSYLMLTQRAGSTFHIPTTQPAAGGPLALFFSELHVRRVIERIEHPALRQYLQTARREGRLHTLIAGVGIAGQEVRMRLQRIRLVAGLEPDPPAEAPWRRWLQPLTDQDIETDFRSGLYRSQPDGPAQAIEVEGLRLPIFPTPNPGTVVISHPLSLPDPLSLQALNQYLHARFDEQPWLFARRGAVWRAQRPMFAAPVEQMAMLARPGLSAVSALNVADHVFQANQGDALARLTRQEHVLVAWQGHSAHLGSLADPIRLAMPHAPTALPGGSGYRLVITPELPTASPASLHLTFGAGEHRRLLAARQAPQPQGIAMLVGNALQHYGLAYHGAHGGVMHYGQANTGLAYLVLPRHSFSHELNLAPQGQGRMLSNAWIDTWLAELPAQQAEPLRQALGTGRLVPLVACVRFGASPADDRLVLMRLQAG
ncbi:hypothetical protein [Pseudomonas typographi]|uniref:hypothetical protein n=1 Tax=Pseudomonas typographi TaxID=2715964 RepID=UPI001687E0A1|nr:hypothetical protein [Pseudomonas typographi]MBD1552240.1 hypothetical protein [Pseudomonas typographi]